MMTFLGAVIFDRFGVGTERSITDTECCLLCRPVELEEVVDPTVSPGMVVVDGMLLSGSLDETESSTKTLHSCIGSSTCWNFLDKERV